MLLESSQLKSEVKIGLCNVEIDAKAYHGVIFNAKLERECGVRFQIFYEMGSLRFMGGEYHGKDVVAIICGDRESISTPRLEAEIMWRKMEGRERPCLFVCGGKQKMRMDIWIWG